MAIIQGLIIIALEAVIATQNSSQAKETQNQSGLANALERLTRIKWENVAFIGFQIWAIFMVLDAVRNEQDLFFFFFISQGFVCQTIQQNAAEVCVLAILYVLCAILGGLQIMDSQRWMAVLKYATTISLTPLRTALTVEIVLTVLLGLFSLSFGFMSYKMTGEFGWMIYKKIGADQAVKRKWGKFKGRST